MNYKYTLAIRELSKYDYQKVLDYVGISEKSKIIGLGRITDRPLTYHEIYIGFNDEDSLFGLEKILNE